MNTVKLKILIVEDDRLITEYLSHLLQKSGYEVSGMVPSGEEALTHIESSIPDLILMDIKLEGAKDGINTAREILKNYDIPIIFTSAYSDESTLESAKDVFPYGYIVKPYGERELEPVIKMALNKHRLDMELKENHSRLKGLLEDDKLEITLKFNPLNQNVEVQRVARGKSPDQAKVLTPYEEKSVPSENIKKKESKKLTEEEIKESDRFKPVYTMKEVTLETGFDANLIRHYEREGLIRPYRNPSNNHRMFTRDEIEWLKNIYHLIHESGLNIEGIRFLLTVTECWKDRICPEDKRSNCPAFFQKNFPCWHFKSEINCCKVDQDCFDCIHYISARRHPKFDIK